MLKNRLVLGIFTFILVFSMFLGTSIFALTRESATAPGEALKADTNETTAVRMYGLFACEVTSTGVGTIQIKRSENGTTNWVVVKTLTNTSAGDRRVYLYEAFGDIDRSPGAYYKAYMSGNPASGSFRVRLVK